MTFVSSCGGHRSQQLVRLNIQCAHLAHRDGFIGSLHSHVSGGRNHISSSRFSILRLYMVKLSSTSPETGSVCFLPRTAVVVLQTRSVVEGMCGMCGIIIASKRDLKVTSNNMNMLAVNHNGAYISVVGDLQGGGGECSRTQVTVVVWMRSSVRMARSPRLNF